MPRESYEINKVFVQNVQKSVNSSNTIIIQVNKQSRLIQYDSFRIFLKHEMVSNKTKIVHVK